MASSFSKKLSKNDIEQGLAIPAEKLRLFKIPDGEQSAEFVAFDTTGREWPFVLSVPTASLKDGWIRFVGEKGLKKDDKITFYFEETRANGVRIRIQEEKGKPFTVFGSNLRA